MTRKLSLSLALASAALLSMSSLVMADPIDLQLNIGTPAYYPPAVVATPPLMVWLSNLGAYAAYGSSQPIFYVGSNYYYYYGNRWWAGPGFRGPWRPIAAPPPGLRRWSPGEWGRVQRDAQFHARDPHWRHFRPQARPMPPMPPQYRPQYGHPPHPQGPGRGEYPGGWNGPGNRGHDQGNQGRGDHGHGPGNQGRGDHGRGQPWQNH